MDKPVFVDAWAWLGISNRRDPWHDAAYRGYLALSIRETPLVTTNAVLYEVYENSRRRFGHAAPMAISAVIARALADGQLTLIYVDGDLEQEAWALYQRFADQDLSLTDCLSFAVMSRLGIGTAFTGDRHFLLLGFEIIPGVQP